MTRIDFASPGAARIDRGTKLIVRVLSVIAAGVLTLTLAPVIPATADGGGTRDRAAGVEVWVVPVYSTSPPGADFVGGVESTTANVTKFLQRQTGSRYTIATKAAVRLDRVPTCRGLSAQLEATLRRIPGYGSPVGRRVVVLAGPKDQFGCQWFEESASPKALVTNWDGPASLAQLLGFYLRLHSRPRLDCAAVPGGQAVSLGGSCEGQPECAAGPLGLPSPNSNGSCVAFGNPYSIMGSNASPTGLANLTGMERVNLGLRASPSVFVDGSKTVRIYQPLAGDRGPVAAYIPWRIGGKFVSSGIVDHNPAGLGLEFNQATGDSAWLADGLVAANGRRTPNAGVTVNLVGDSQYGPEGLINSHPEQSEDRLSTALAAGDTWTTPDGIVSLRVLTITQDYADVEVTSRLPADTRPPRPTEFFSIYTTGRTKGSLREARVQWGGNDDVGVASAKLKFPGGVRDLQITNAMGSVAEGEITLWLPRGKDRFTLTLTDYAGNVASRNYVKSVN